MEFSAVGAEIITICKPDLFILGLRQIPGGNGFGARILDHLGIGVWHRYLARTSLAFQLFSHQVYENQGLFVSAIGWKFTNSFEVCPATKEKQTTTVITADVTLGRDDTTGLGGVPSYHQYQDQNKAQQFRFYIPSSSDTSSIDFGRFRGIYSVKSHPEFGLLGSGDLDRIAIRYFGNCPGDGADRSTSEREGCEEKGYQSCKQAKDEKIF